MQTLTNDPGPLRVMIYGVPKSGKTVLAHSFPNTFTFDFDKGLLSVSSGIQSGLIKGKTPEDIQFQQFDMTQDPRKSNIFDEITIAIDHIPTDRDTIILDSMSALNQIVMVKALKENNKLGISKSLAKLTASGVVPTTQSDYLSAMQLSEKLIDEFSQLNVNLIVLCHEYILTNSDGAVIGYRPLLLGQLRERLAAKFDELWRTKIDAKGKRTIIMQGKSSFPAGSRLGCFDAEEPMDFYALQKKASEFFGIAKDQLWHPATGESSPTSKE